MTKLALMIATCVACSAPATRSQPDHPMTSPGGSPVTHGEPPPADPATGCPAIQLKAPDSVSAGAPARVSAIISGGPTSIVYTWKLSTGRITSGQHSPELVIDTKGLAGVTITATLELGGLATTCATTTANAAILIGPAS